MQIKELGHIVLYVTNISLMGTFYREILGFEQIHAEGRIALFSSGRTHHEMLLIEIGGQPKPHRVEPGLYHIGFKIGDGPEAAKQAYKELLQKGIPIVGTGDHGVTHSIYILDPDGNELELYADVSEAWRTDPKAVMTPVRALDLD